MNIGLEIAGIADYALTTFTNPINLIITAVFSEDMGKQLLKGPLKYLECIGKFSLKPIIEHNIKLTCITYNNVLYEPIVLPLSNIVESLSNIIGATDIPTAEFLRNTKSYLEVNFNPEFIQNQLISIDDFGDIYEFLQFFVIQNAKVLKDVIDQIKYLVDKLNSNSK